MIIKCHVLVGGNTVGLIVVIRIRPARTSMRMVKFTIAMVATMIY